MAATAAAATVGATVDYETPTGMIAAQLNEEATELLTESIKKVLRESGCADIPDLTGEIN